MSVEPRLTTERLVLRPPTEADADFHARLRAHRDVVRYTSRRDPRTREESLAEWDEVLRGRREHGFGSWVVCDRATGELVGVIDVGVIDKDFSGIRRGEVDIGWTVDPARWGEGIATEAASAVLEDCLERLRIPTVVAHTRSTNRASVRVMEKIGMRFRCHGRTLNGDPALVYEAGRATAGCRARQRGDSATSSPPSVSYAGK